MALVWHCPTCSGVVVPATGSCRACGFAVRVPIERRAHDGTRRAPGVVAAAVVSSIVLGAAALGGARLGGDDRSTAPVRPTGQTCQVTATAPPVMDTYELIVYSAGPLGRLADQPC